MGMGMGMVMVMGGGMARVVVRCHMPAELGAEKSFAGSRHGWCFMGLGLEVLVSISALVESLGIGTGLHGILGQGIGN